MKLLHIKPRLNKTLNSMKFRLIEVFCLISVLPFIIVSLISYYNTTSIIEENTKQLSETNLIQTAKNVHSSLSTYEDLLFQMYTDDDIVKYIDKLNNNSERAMAVNQLRKKLQGIANVKNYIQAITIITEKGDVIFYDKIAPYSVRTSWLDNIGMTPEMLYSSIYEELGTQYISTRYASTFSAKPFYLFHLGHRIVDYKSIQREIGVIILSIHERFLNDACNQNTLFSDENTFHGSFNFIVDEEGRLVTFPDQTMIDSTYLPDPKTVADNDEVYRQFIRSSRLLDGNYILIQSQYDKVLGWNFVNVSDQDVMINQIEQQRNLTLLVIFLSLIFVVVTILIFINRMTGSIKNVVKAMKKAGQGNLEVRVIKDKNITTEIEIITDQFNRMMAQMNDLMKQIKVVSTKQKNAEIAALEAQINPHFLYNTLDTINWMAIDSDQYEISYAIGALARILRYGIDKSNGIVTLKKEMEWLKQYIFLQQTRLENSFDCQILVSPELLSCQIHKLLFQPFVENSIIHGFEGVDRHHDLTIKVIEDPVETLTIIVKDNGKGMSPEKIKEIKSGALAGTENKNHIGMNNAIERLKMYYGDTGKFDIQSTIGEGTTVIIQIPKLVEGEE